MRRVVVTGVGAVSPCGLDTESTWESICAGRSGIGRIEGFDASTFASQIAGECSGFDVEQFFEKKRVREGDRFIHLAMAASTHAVKSSGLEVSGDAPGEGVPAPLEHPRLVSEIIEKMGGQIATVSEPPVGRVTAIWLRRPRA